MGHLADLIEEFILKKMTTDHQEATVVQRNELAEELQCAPSQISYVLSTRFTVERGYLVESRRGSGGFVRIVRIPVLQVAIAEVQPDRVEQLVGKLAHQGQLTSREAEMVLHFFRITQDRFPARERGQIIRSLLLKLTRRPKEE